jgi:hypothetical protein
LKKCALKSKVFNNLCIKCIFMVRGTVFTDILVLQNIFQCFKVRKLKKFGKHCRRA